AAKAAAIDLAGVRKDGDERIPVALERLGAAARARRRVTALRKLLQPALRVGLPQKLGDPFDRLGPHHRNEMKRASSNSPWSRSTSSEGAGVSIGRALSACPPPRVRDTG